MSERTPWADWLRAGIAAGFQPEHFWRLSVKEWRALSAPQIPHAFDRATFYALAARFPDQHNG